MGLEQFFQVQITFGQAVQGGLHCRRSVVVNALDGDFTVVEAVGVQFRGCSRCATAEKNHFSSGCNGPQCVGPGGRVARCFDHQLSALSSVGARDQLVAVVTFAIEILELVTNAELPGI